MDTNIYPLDVKDNHAIIERILENGWYGIEPTHIWSKDNASLTLPVPDICTTNYCELSLSAYAYGASEQRPVNVTIQNNHDGQVYEEKVSISDSNTHKLNIELNMSARPVTVTLSIPEAISPQKLQGANDNRQLGIALQSINITHITPLSADIYPLDVKDNHAIIERILENGWYGIEPTHIWSKDNASLTLPVPDICTTNYCELSLSAYAYGASEQRPVNVTIQNNHDGQVYEEKVSISDSNTHKLNIELNMSARPVTVTLSIPEAISPQKLQGANDNRQLGIALQSINILVIGDKVIEK